MINDQGELRRLLSEHRQIKLAQLAYERELGITPAARMALKANGASAALDLAEITEPVSERVIEVGRSRGKTMDVVEDGGDDRSKSRDRTDDEPAGF